MLPYFKSFFDDKKQRVQVSQKKEGWYYLFTTSTVPFIVKG
jgi:hypothetical protein